MRGFLGGALTLSPAPYRRWTGVRRTPRAADRRPVRPCPAELAAKLMAKLGQVEGGSKVLAKLMAKLPAKFGVFQ